MCSLSSYLITLQTLINLSSQLLREERCHYHQFTNHRWSQKNSQDCLKAKCRTQTGREMQFCSNPLVAYKPFLGVSSSYKDKGSRKRSVLTPTSTQSNCCFKHVGIHLHLWVHLYLRVHSFLQFAPSLKAEQFMKYNRFFPLHGKIQHCR